MDHEPNEWNNPSTREDKKYDLTLLCIEWIEITRIRRQTKGMKHVVSVSDRDCDVWWTLLGSSNKPGRRRAKVVVIKLPMRGTFYAIMQTYKLSKGEFENAYYK